MLHDRQKGCASTPLVISCRQILSVDHLKQSATECGIWVELSFIDGFIK
jgi:hypothetical protein